MLLSVPLEDNIWFFNLFWPSHRCAEQSLESSSSLSWDLADLGADRVGVLEALALADRDGVADLVGVRVPADQVGVRVLADRVGVRVLAAFLVDLQMEYAASYLLASIVCAVAGYSKIALADNPARLVLQVQEDPAQEADLSNPYMGL
ncbi:hypothetical protein L6164_034632 [Bauhinia variegata]|uniref:Uncharacterized protein n=1 Tax=Bauhinia variegata TaxID=167791 RepID=A0ACB9KVT0_BAUVA|nr:hypothetical protein L6164_034632 [Bauhinia variegata]